MRVAPLHCYTEVGRVQALPNSCDVECWSQPAIRAICLQEVHRHRHTLARETKINQQSEENQRTANSSITKNKCETRTAQKVICEMVDKQQAPEKRRNDPHTKTNTSKHTPQTRSNKEGREENAQTARSAFAHTHTHTCTHTHTSYSRARSCESSWEQFVFSNMSSSGSRFGCPSGTKVSSHIPMRKKLAEHISSI